ncbi:hypothetical protein ZWY2020_020405 [Hordeum vulgare]|nr:hypothetical protein ZWY2020_020405 [Hordeum vulgare]
MHTRRGAGRVGKKGKGTGRGGGRGRGRRTVAPSSPATPPHSSEHSTTMVDPFVEEAMGTPVQEPRVDGHSAHETLIQDQPRVEVPSAHETPVPEATSQETPTTHASAHVERSRWVAWPDRTEVSDWTEGPGGCFVDGGDESIDSEGYVEVDGAKVYKHGSTCFPVAPGIKPGGYRGWKHPCGVPKPNCVLDVLCRTNFPRPSIGVRRYMGRRRPRFSRLSAHHSKMEMPELYDLYGMAHTASYKKAKALFDSDLDDQNNLTNILSHHKLMKYRDTGKAWKGEDFNLSQEPLDPELVMISGDGRPHGSIAIGDGIIRCPLTLPEIKVRQSSSCPKIRPHPWLVDLAIEKERAANEAALEKERAATEAALEKERAASQAALEEMDQTIARLIEEEGPRNEAAHLAMYELIVSMYDKSNQAPPPMPVLCVIGMNNSRAASHDPSLGQPSPNEADASNPGVSPP